MSKDLTGAGVQIQSVLTMPESYAKQVFSLVLKPARDVQQSTMSAGREFQTAAAEQRKARSAK